MPNQDPGDSENRTTVPEGASHVVNEDGAAAYNRGDYATARRLWLPLAEGGNADAQTMLGIIYEGGHGVSQDYAAAVTWYRRAADQGHPDAQFYLACMHDFGKGVPLDPAAAVKWLSKAADQGHTDAQFNLGVMYEDGIGVSQDHQTAVSWYREAAEQGHAKAQNNLGAMFVEGKASRRITTQPLPGSARRLLTGTSRASSIWVSCTRTERVSRRIRTPL